ncbi:MAG: hypothetical protein JST04_09090 [Bdellovibrionales bacterium]|nr:hypothetical protein [Bdellovibrionales bacterium]
MKISHLLPFAALTVLATGCIQPERIRLAQQASLEDTIRFTSLTVSGDLVTLKISRVDPKLPNTRATGVDPIEFPEYATFRIKSSGLEAVADQTHLYIPVSDAKCEDADCVTLSFTMKRAGGTVADTAHLRSKRLTDVNCNVWIRETNGADSTTTPSFATATLTSIVSGNDEGRYAFYGQSNSVLPNGYHAKLFLRNFSGAPSELWIDEIDSSLNSSGQSVPVGTSVRTFDADGMVASASALNLTASDSAGRRVQVGCNY